MKHKKKRKTGGEMERNTDCKGQENYGPIPHNAPENPLRSPWNDATHATYRERAPVKLKHAHNLIHIHGVLVFLLKAHSRVTRTIPELRLGTTTVGAAPTAVEARA